MDYYNLSELERDAIFRPQFSDDEDEKFYQQQQEKKRQEKKEAPPQIKRQEKKQEKKQPTKQEPAPEKKRRGRPKKQQPAPEKKETPEPEKKQAPARPARPVIRAPEKKQAPAPEKKQAPALPPRPTVRDAKEEKTEGTIFETLQDRIDRFEREDAIRQKARDDLKEGKAVMLSPVEIEKMEQDFDDSVRKILRAEEEKERKAQEKEEARKTKEADKMKMIDDIKRLKAVRFTQIAEEQDYNKVKNYHNALLAENKAIGVAVEKNENIEEKMKEEYRKLKRKYLGTRKIMTKEEHKIIVRLAQREDRLGIEYSDEFGNKQYRNLNFTNETQRENFITALYDGYDLKEGRTDNSVANSHLLFRMVSNPRLIKIQKRGRRDKAGNYFNYYNTTNLDLTRYQIYHEERDFKENKDYAENGAKHCLIHVLEQHRILPAVINQVFLAFQENTFIEKRDLKKVSDILQKSIILYFTDDMKRNTEEKKTVKRRQHYGDYADTVSICLIEKHYFIYEPVRYTEFYTKNYNLCKDNKRGNEIIHFNGGRNMNLARYRTTHPLTDSFTLITNFLKSNLFKHIEFRADASIEQKGIDLSNISEEQRLYDYNEPENKRCRIFYADTETVVEGDEGKHVIFLTGIINETDEDSQTYAGANCINEMLDYVYNDSTSYEKVIVYFHNLKYDINILGRSLLFKKSIEKSGNYYEVDILYRGRTMSLRDSYKLISKPLRNFQKAFNLPFGKKEAIAYEFYKLNTPEIVSVEEYSNRLRNDEERKIFMEALEEDKNDIQLFDYDGKNFNCLEYYKYYLNFDCLTLRGGMVKFNENINELTNGTLSTSNVLTTSSLGHHFMSGKGVYNNVYQCKGNLRAYIAKAIAGGRVHVNEKYVCAEIKSGVSYIDACSLYPSAMNRLGREGGYATGEAVYFQGTPPADNSYFIATVEITEIKKNQQMPFVCVKDNKNRIQYVNNLDGSTTVIIGKITLEDLVRFHQIEYKFIEGVYWTGERNGGISDVIQNLYNSRLTYKKSGNALMSEMVKLVMNSAYGKTIMKTSKSEIVYRNNIEYVEKYYDVIESFADKGMNQYRIKKYCSDNSYNMASVGVQILEMSRRIMNELFDVANDMKAPIYYTDTDSLSIDSAGLPCVIDEYKNRYGRNLMGDTLETFQYDFDFKSELDKKEIKSVASIFLGRKAYIHTVSDGTRTEYIYKMKGIPHASIIDTAEKKYGGDVYALYLDLSTGAEVEFCLNPVGGAPSFEFKNSSVFTRATGSFVRKLKFDCVGGSNLADDYED